MFERLNLSLERGMAKQVFDHLRNFLICAFLLAIGTSELKYNISSFGDMIPGSYSGAGIIAIACFLTCFNLYDGIRRISGSKYHLVLTVGLVALYLFFSFRIVEIAWDFRVTPMLAPGALP